MKIHTSTGRQATLDNVVITAQEHDVQMLLDLDERMMEYHGLRRGDILIVETAKTTVETEMRKEYRWGYNGMLREHRVSRKEEVVATETRKLWKTNKRGWYWK